MAGDRPGRTSGHPNTDVLPMLNDVNPGFDSVLRGYDRAQVDSYLARVDADIRALVADRDASAARTADLAAQLAGAQAQIESLRRQLRSATEEVTADNVDPHINAMLKSAQNEAAALRARAHQEAEVIRNAAADGAARTRAAAQAEAQRINDAATVRQAQAEEFFRQRMSEIDSHRATVESELSELIVQTRDREAALTRTAHADRQRLDAESAAERERLQAECVRLNADATAERERLDAEAAARRTRAEQDFEMVLRERRSAEYGEIERRTAEGKVEAGRLVEDARRVAEEIVEAARVEVRRLAALREDAHEHLRTLHSRLGREIRRSSAAAPADE